jgi:hypothetical protein
MGEWNFNRRQCVHALLKLGFYLDNDRSGGHDKYAFPDKLKIEKNQRPFVTVPRHNELKVQLSIVKQLKRIGGDELLNEFKKLL